MGSAPRQPFAPANTRGSGHWRWHFCKARWNGETFHTVEMPGTVVRYTRPGKHLRNHGKSPIFNEKIHYFDWAIFNSELFVYQRVANFGTKKTTIMDKSSDLSFDLIGFYSDLMGFEWIQKIILKNAGKRSEVGAKDSMKRHCVQCAEVKQSSLQDLFACG